MFRIPGADGLVEELRDSLGVQRQLLESLVRQVGRELGRADASTPPPSPHDAPAVHQCWDPDDGIVTGTLDLTAILPEGKYASRGYVANQDGSKALWVRVITPSGARTERFVVPAGYAWPFPCNVQALVIEDDGAGTTSTRWQVLAQ